MTGPQVIVKVKELNFPEGSYVVFGAAPLAAAGLREANDIDFLVTPQLLEDIQQRPGWHQVFKGPKDEPYENGIYEVHANWDFSTYAPTLEHLLQTATYIDGVPFAALDEVRKWKLAWGRPKDMQDVALIDAHFSNRGLS